MSDKWVRVLFVIAGLYDGILGLAFLSMPEAIFAFYAVEPPNHVGYVEFPAALLLIFAVMFFRIASNPYRFRELILYGCGLKLAYSILVFKHEMAAGVPAMWVPWAWVDIAFLVLFLIAWYRIGKLDRPD